jgi:hypothetical protein
VAVAVGLVGLVITATATWTAWTINHRNEQRLLQLQTRQAAAVISSSILGLRGPLSTALQIETATGGDVRQFTRFMSSYTGPGRPFVSASIWKTTGPRPGPIASIGVRPKLDPSSRAAQAFVRLAMHSPTFVVTALQAGRSERIGYAVANLQSPTFVVYAERAIPPDRTVPVEKDSAFADLNYATYFGSTTDASHLATTDLPPSQLPLPDTAARVTIPFGDSTLTLVATPSVALGGSLGPALPWIFLVGGILLTVATVFIAESLVRRGRDAETDARTISELYGQLEALYGDQRTIAEALQRALLPPYDPSIPGLEIASRYVAGAVGVDVGGDWYSLIAVDEERFGFVVGDVSGRGVSAATIMARLRYTIRAYLLEGHPPDVVLEMVARQLDVNEDGHFATVLVGIGHHRTREVTVANAGLLNPLVVSSTPEFVQTKVGLPLGVALSSYTCTTIVVPPGSTLLAFTDGLVERRGEDIDVGLDRVAAAVDWRAPTLDGMLTSLVSSVAEDGSEDDIAILAFRWGPAG